MGGFGNNLFHLILFFKLKNTSKSKIKLVDFLIKENAITRLLGWKIHPPLIYNFVPKKHFSERIKLSLYFTLIIYFFKSLAYKLLEPNVKFHQNEISPTYLMKTKNYFGYFQNKEFLNTSKIEFSQLKSMIHSKIIFNKPQYESVIHYRWGDSVWAKNNMRYYNEIKRGIIGNQKVLIVTDDIKNAKNFFKDTEYVEIVSSVDPTEDFLKLLLGEKLICAPSTFSWWASQLCFEQTEIVMPKMLYELLGHYTENKLILK